MKRLLTWMCLVAVSHVVYAVDGHGGAKQDAALKQAARYPAASYEKAVAEAKEALAYFESNKDSQGMVRAYITLGHIHHRSRRYPEALRYDSLALSRAAAVDYGEGRARAFGNIAREMKALGNMNASKENYEAALALTHGEASGAVDDLLTYYNQLGIVCRILGQFQQSVDYFSAGIQLAEAHQRDKFLALLYMNNANTLTEISQYDGAVDLHLKSIRIKEQLKDSLGMLQSYNNIAVVFRRAREFDQATAYYKKSGAIAEQLQDFSGLGLNAVNLAVVQIEQHHTDSVAGLFEAALQYFNKSGDVRGLGLAYHNYGNFMLDEGRLNQAGDLMEKALALREKVGSDIEIASTLSNLGRLALAQHDIRRAEKYLMDASRRIDTTLNTAYVKDLYHYLVQLYVAKGDKVTAFVYQTKLLEMERTMFTENERINLLKATSEYELEKRDLQLALEQEKQRKRQSMIILIAAVAVVSFTGLSGMLLLRRKRLRENHQAALTQLAQQHQIDTAKALRKAEEDERRKIAEKLHDDVGALLSIAKLNVNQVGEHTLNTGAAMEKLNTTEQLLDEMAATVRGLSHSLMPVALEKYGLKPAMLDLINHINAAGKIKIEHVIEGLDDTQHWEDEFCLGVYRIVQELINNVIKHAHATHVLVQLVELDDSVTIYLEDNGRGLDHKAKSDGLGLNLLKSNIEYLNGAIEINGRKNRGTFVLIELPLAVKKG